MNFPTKPSKSKFLSGGFSPLLLTPKLQTFEMVLSGRKRTFVFVAVNNLLSALKFLKNA